MIRSPKTDLVGTSLLLSWLETAHLVMAMLPWLETANRSLTLAFSPSPSLSCSCFLSLSCFLLLSLVLSLSCFPTLSSSHSLSIAIAWVGRPVSHGLSVCLLVSEQPILPLPTHYCPCPPILSRTPILFRFFFSVFGTLRQQSVCGESSRRRESGGAHYHFPRMRARRRVQIRPPIRFLHLRRFR